MLTIDISKAIPRSALTYLVALVPGLFFGMALMLGNPELVRDLLSRSKTVYGFNAYVLLTFALVLAFIVGNAFVIFVVHIQWIFRYVILLRIASWRMCCKTLLLPRLTRMTHTPGKQNPAWLNRMYLYVSGKSMLWDPRLHEVQKCWHVVASELLQRKYGIRDYKVAGSDWGVWYSALWVPSNAERRGSLFAIAFHATGWSGLVAARFAPALRYRWFLFFSLFLIGCGIVHDFFVARNHVDPVYLGLVRINNALAQLRTVVASKNESAGPIALENEEA
jgi:hypothetical protein